MSRQITSGMEAESTAKSLSPFYMADLHFEEGSVYVFTGVGSISWGGHTYQGLGKFGQVEMVTESAGIQANGISMQLSGIPSEFVNLAFSNTYQGRGVSLYLACMTDGGALVADPLLIFRGQMDTITIQDTGQTATITLAVESELIELNQASNRRYTDEDQQFHFPGDLGLQHIAALQDKEIQWGSGTNSAYSNKPGDSNSGGGSGGGAGSAFMGLHGTIGRGTG